MIRERDAENDENENSDDARGSSAHAPTRRSTTRIIEQVTELVTPILKASGLDLDRVEYGDYGRNGLLQVFVDKPGDGTGGGVGIEECVDVSRQLSAALDLHDVIRRHYTLEVSSPGLTRPLKRPEDYERFAGRLAILHLRRPVEGRRQVLGVLKGRTGDTVAVEEKKTGVVLRIPLEAVAKARLEIET